MLSLVATGIAPGSFYELNANGSRQRAHYDGLPVDFIAEAIATLGAQMVDEYQTYHVLNPYDDDIGLDEYVDWLIDAGYRIDHIPDYGEWLQRCSRPRCARCRNAGASSRCCHCCTTTSTRRSRYAERWHPPNDSTGRFKRRKLTQTTTSHTLRPISS